MTTEERIKNAIAVILSRRYGVKFRRIEMQKIKAVFPNCSMDYLFAQDGIIDDSEHE